MKKTLSFLLISILSISNCKYSQKKSDKLFPFPDAKGKWGYVDEYKNQKIPFIFDGAGPFFEDRAFVGRIVPGKDEPVYSVIDRDGKIVFDMPVFYAAPEELWQLNNFKYSEGLLLAPENGEGTSKEIVYLDKNGKTSLSVPKGKEENTVFASGFSEGLAYIQTTESNWKYIDKTGKTVLEGRGEAAPLERDFQSGWAAAVLPEANQVTLLNKKGEKAPFLKGVNILDIAAMHEGYSLVEVLEKDQPVIKVLKSDGTMKKVEIPLVNSSPVTTTTGYNFSEGLALVHYSTGQSESYQDLQGYLNPEGKLEFELPEKIRPRKVKYNDMEMEGMVNGTGFHQGLAAWKVEVDENSYQIYYIDKKGKVVLESPVVKK